MKKLLAIILALIMTLSLVTLAGCGDDDSDGGSSKKKSRSSSSGIEGSWRCSYDFSPFIQLMFAAMNFTKGYDVPDMIDNFSVKVDLIWEFDGRELTVTADMASYKRSLEKAMPDIREFLEESIKEQMIKTGNEDMDFDDYARGKLGGYSLDEFMDNLEDELDTASYEESNVSSTFAYELADDEITLSREADGEIQKQTYRYQLSDDKLILTELVSGEEYSIYADQLPITFTRE